MSGPATEAGLSGLEYMRAIGAGEVAPPPIAVTLNFSMVSVEHGLATFAYAGDSHADLPIWKAADKAYLVAASSAVTRAALRDSPGGEQIVTLRPAWRSWLRALRPHQWSKNALLFLPLFLARDLAPSGAWLFVLIAFVAFCLAASGVYLANDLFDLAADRQHPRKNPFHKGPSRPPRRLRRRHVESFILARRNSRK